MQMEIFFFLFFIIQKSRARNSFCEEKERERESVCVENFLQNSIKVENETKQMIFTTDCREESGNFPT